ncbi:MAG: hypothetical protein JWP81_4374 [Ferruginibacter sp.]|nr:hypothetical protein [Ferruginibacter sp.]
MKWSYQVTIEREAIKTKGKCLSFKFENEKIRKWLNGSIVHLIR